MWKWIKYCLIVSFLLWGASNGYAQSKNSIKQKKAKISKEINQLNNLLRDTKNNQRKSLLAVTILNKKIGARGELIAAINYEVKYIQREIKQQENKIDSLQENLKILKQQYAEMIVFAYKNRNATNKLVFLFSSQDFNQAFKRLKYINEIAEYRDYQAHKIEEAKIEIEANIKELEAKKDEKLKLIDSKKDERKKLELEQNKKKDLIANLRKDEKNLRKKISKKQKEASKLENELRRIIAEEIRKAKEAGKKKNGKMQLTPKAQLLAKNFTSNKGKLPWPVVQGYISKSFGRNKHEVLEVVTINNGVDILSVAGAKARAVFKGQVAAVLVLPGDKYAVIVQHGNYFTMYSNLSKVFVKKGDEVETEESIGLVITDEDGKTEVHFELWDGANKQNPSLWLAKK